MSECRVKLMAEGKPYPRSNCAKCGSILRPFMCAEQSIPPAKPSAIINDPETFATQIGFAMRLADAPLSEQQFVTLCSYLKVRSEPE